MGFDFYTSNFDVKGEFSLQTYAFSETYEIILKIYQPAPGNLERLAEYLLSLLSDLTALGLKIFLGINSRKKRHSNPKC